MNKNVPVIIVGAGLSGLHIASLLTARGFNCSVLESRERIGGRVLSEEIANRPNLGRFDLGPTWFWPRYERTITKLVKELGLRTFEQYNEGLMLSERSRNEPAQQYALPKGSIERSLRIMGGVQSLIDAIAATLPPGTIHLNTRVTSIRQEGDGAVTLKTEGKRDHIRAGAVILTLPPRMVARNITFWPQLPPDLMDSMVNKPTWMAAHAKAIAVYERPFWREQGLSGLASSWIGPLQEIHDASPESGAGALFGFFGIPAKTRQELGEDKVLNLVVEQLTRLFGPAAENVSAVLYKDWSRDPDTTVDEDAEPLGDYPSYGPLVGVESWGKKIIFAGTETASEQGEHLEGALQSAERAVSELMELYKTHE
ncbi:flavin monoamine oxidase family protein [Paenibacillus dokdonensis]|uniref:flavin monoamine oxidase family protein n=1 Tax=Paenibacillus dokdonensis TaxID=2567944 RepID=UPI001B3C8229|nr:FAD-dependent oxidoreductase [Paenibacillus dokdonensis]